MDSHASIRIQDLSQAISLEHPTGTDVRSSGPGTELYYQIKDARSKARSAERKALFEEETNLDASKAWSTILEIAPILLKEHTKDLEITAWYTEALLRKTGFQGLADGFLLASTLIENFWEQLYPLPDEEGLESRISAFIGLNGDSSEGTLIRPMRLVSLHANPDSRPFNYSDYQQARSLEKIKDEEQKASRHNEIGFELKDIESAIAGSDQAWCVQQDQALTQALEHLQQLSDVFYKHCSHDAPPQA